MARSSPRPSDGDLASRSRSTRRLRTSASNAHLHRGLMKHQSVRRNCTARSPYHIDLLPEPQQTTLVLSHRQPAEGSGSCCGGVERCRTHPQYRHVVRLGQCSFLDTVCVAYLNTAAVASSGAAASLGASRGAMSFGHGRAKSGSSQRMDRSAEGGTVARQFPSCLSRLCTLESCARGKMRTSFGPGRPTLSCVVDNCIGRDDHARAVQREPESRIKVLRVANERFIKSASLEEPRAAECGIHCVDE